MVIERASRRVAPHAPSSCLVQSYKYIYIYSSGPVPIRVYKCVHALIEVLRAFCNIPRPHQRREPLRRCGIPEIPRSHRQDEDNHHKMFLCNCWRCKVYSRTGVPEISLATGLPSITVVTGLPVITVYQRSEGPQLYLCSLWSQVYLSVITVAPVVPVITVATGVLALWLQVYTGSL